MINLEAIKARRDRTMQEVAKVCKDRSEWRMRIPVNEDDSDRVIYATCRDVDALVAEVERLRLELNADAIDHMTVFKMPPRNI